MKNKILFLSVALLLSFFTIAQTDTIFYYWNKDGQTCDKDTAVSYGKLYPLNERWAREEYNVEKNHLYFEGVYLEKDCKKADGRQVRYQDNGSIDNVTNYDSGKIINRTYYHNNGSKKGYISYTDSLQQGWDEQGREIKDYIVESFPLFGAEWRNYIARNLNGKIAVDAGLPEGNHYVIVKFVVDKTGKITNVTASKVPAGCPRCGDEAIRVISNGPAFQPPIQNNKIIDFQATQPVVFRVEDGGMPVKKKRL